MNWSQSAWKSHKFQMECPTSYSLNHSYELLVYVLHAWQEVIILYLKYKSELVVGAVYIMLCNSVDSFKCESGLWWWKIMKYKTLAIILCLKTLLQLYCQWWLNVENSSAYLNQYIPYSLWEIPVLVFAWKACQQTRAESSLWNCLKQTS